MPQRTDLINSTIAAITAVLLWLGYSRIGKASRAISDNPALASASGINVERVINVVWAVGAGLAGLSGVLYAMNIGVTWLMGVRKISPRLCNAHRWTRSWSEKAR